MKTIEKLIDVLKKEETFYIQTHNFPDHDAVASAFALQQLLVKMGMNPLLVYDGEIQRDSLKSMIELLKIDIKHISEYNMIQKDKIVIVDGCKYNKNVTDLIGDEIAVIDHHQVEKPEDVLFADIRSEYGACSTIIFEYYSHFKIDPTENTATALMIGINMDTSLLTRDVAHNDVIAYSNLYDPADMRTVNSILRNFIQVKDLNFYRQAIDNLKIKDTFAFCYFEEGCNQNLLGILGDFFLALEEVDFVALCANNNEKINFSVRNERDQWNAAQTIEKVLQGIGFGGGHVDMAGGIIKDKDLFDEKMIYDKFIKSLGLK